MPRRAKSVANDAYYVRIGKPSRTSGNAGLPTRLPRDKDQREKGEREGALPWPSHQQQELILDVVRALIITHAVMSSRGLPACFIIRLLVCSLFLEARPRFAVVCATSPLPVEHPPSSFPAASD